MTETLTENRRKSLANLRPVPFKKGNKFGVGHGRPRKKAWLEELDDFASSNKEFVPLLRRALHKKPIEVLHLLAGKPREQIIIDQTLKAEITTQEVVDVAKAAREKLEQETKTDSPKTP